MAQKSSVTIRMGASRYEAFIRMSNGTVHKMDLQDYQQRGLLRSKLRDAFTVHSHKGKHR